MFKQNVAVTIFFDSANQKREGDVVLSTQMTSHFEIGAEVSAGEVTKTVVSIVELAMRKGVVVKFSDGIAWKYVGFNYILS
jgi:hypothetical protein